MPVSTLESESCAAAAALLGTYEFLLPSLKRIINHGPRISLKAEAMKNAKASENFCFPNIICRHADSPQCNEELVERATSFQTAPCGDQNNKTFRSIFFSCILCFYTLNGCLNTIQKTLCNLRLTLACLTVSKAELKAKLLLCKLKFQRSASSDFPNSCQRFQ